MCVRRIHGTTGFTDVEGTLDNALTPSVSYDNVIHKMRNVSGPTQLESSPMWLERLRVPPRGRASNPNRIQLQLGTPTKCSMLHVHARPP